MSAAHLLPLHRHPAAPCRAVSAIAVGAAFADDGALRIAWRLSGNPSVLKLPDAAPPGPADGLWRHTCCEAFVAAVDAPEYREFNFSPSGQWAAYRFTGYRERDTAFAPPVAPTTAFTRFADGCELVATLAPSLLPAGHRLRFGLTAVVEDVAGGISHWALTHPAAQPDFHLRAGFALAVDRQ